jgi:putative oxidoreductase
MQDRLAPSTELSLGRARLALVWLRVLVAGELFVHGAARLVAGPGAFGDYLAGRGFPLGGAIAWTITLVELVGGLALAAGFLVRPLSAWFAGVLAMGIVLVHAPAGWFVVGAGRNGMEFSVLLIGCLAAIAWAHPLPPPGGGR